MISRRENQPGAWAFWAVEAAIIVGITALCAWVTEEDPYCEQCDQWAKETTDFAVVRGASELEVKAWVEAQDFEKFKTVPAPRASASW